MCGTSIFRQRPSSILVRRQARLTRKPHCDIRLQRPRHNFGVGVSSASVRPIPLKSSFVRLSPFHSCAVLQDAVVSCPRQRVRVQQARHTQQNSCRKKTAAQRRGTRSRRPAPLAACSQSRSGRSLEWEMTPWGISAGRGATRRCGWDQCAPAVAAAITPRSRRPHAKTTHCRHWSRRRLLRQKRHRRNGTAAHRLQPQQLRSNRFGQRAANWVAFSAYLFTKQRLQRALVSGINHTAAV